MGLPEIFKATWQVYVRIYSKYSQEMCHSWLGCRGSITAFHTLIVLQWRHNEHDSVSNHQRLESLLNRCRSKKTSKLHVTGLCEGNSPFTGEFPGQWANNAENVSIWWRLHVSVLLVPVPQRNHWLQLTMSQEIQNSKCSIQPRQLITITPWLLISRIEFNCLLYKIAAFNRCWQRYSAAIDLFVSMAGDSTSTYVRWVIISSAQIFHCVKKVTPGLTVSVAKHMLVQRNWHENGMIQFSFACPWTLNNHVRILLKCFVFAAFLSVTFFALPMVGNGAFIFILVYFFSGLEHSHYIVMLTQFHQFTSTKIIVDIDLTFPFQFRKPTARNNVVAAQPMTTMLSKWRPFR